MDTVEKINKLKTILNLLSQEDKDKSIIEINNNSKQHKEIIDCLEKEIGRNGIEWCYEVSYNRPAFKIREKEGQAALISYNNGTWYILIWQIERFFKAKIK